MNQIVLRICAIIAAAENSGGNFRFESHWLQTNVMECVFTRSPIMVIQTILKLPVSILYFANLIIRACKNGNPLLEILEQNESRYVSQIDVTYIST